MIVSDKDRARLRSLAKIQVEYAQSEVNKNIIKEWYRHHRFEKGRPMIHLEVGTFAQEVISPRLQCEGEFARSIEWTLLDNFINHEVFGDDRPVKNYFAIQRRVFFNLFDLKIKRVHVNNDEEHNVGHQFQHVIHDLKNDYDILKKSTYGYNKEDEEKYKTQVEEIIGDILPVKVTMGCLYTCPTQSLVHIMGMQTMFMAMIDYPELFHEMMSRVADDTIEYFNWLQEQKLLLPTTGDESLAQGSWCFTDELPKDKEKILTTDVWGFMDSQETVGISPQMFDEFIFPTYMKISKKMGLLSYACCEPVDVFWEKSLSQYENLRKISISPWCNEEYMGDILRNKKVIYHRKPSPNYIGVPEILDEEAFREHIRATLIAAKGCQLEIAQRDVYTIHSNEVKARRYIDIIKEEIDSNWIV